MSTINVLWFFDLTLLRSISYLNFLLSVSIFHLFQYNALISLIDISSVIDVNTGGTRKLTELNNINFVDIAPFIKNEIF